MSAGQSAFFYGILMHPKILKDVIRNDGSHLKLCPAVLLVSLVCSITRHSLLISFRIYGSFRSIPDIKSRFLKFGSSNMFVRLDGGPSMLITLESYHTQGGKPCLKIVN